MGWRKTPKQEAQRDDYATELAKKLQASDTKTSRIWKACLMEISERSPDNIYYPIELLKLVIASFIVADGNIDGEVTFEELLRVFPADGSDAMKSAKEAFKEMDISGDEKLTLAEFIILGFFKAERLNDYPSAVE